MNLLIAGLVLFIAIHSIRVVAPRWRLQQQQRWGEGTWKALYSLLSLAGVTAIVVGFDQAREHPVVIWLVPNGMQHATALCTLLAFVLWAAAFVPANHLKARLGHPMVAGVKIWALGHLLSNGMLAHLVLFGSFLLWAILDFAILRRRDRREGVQYPRGQTLPTLWTVVLGVVAWAVFAFGLHGILIGIKPLG